jgi:hypothetical protein
MDPRRLRQSNIVSHWCFPELKKVVASKASQAYGFGGTGLGDRTRMERGQTLPVLDFDSIKSNAGKMLTQ